MEMLYSTKHGKGIERLYDIVDQNGAILTLDALQNKYGFTIDVMKYNSISTAVPKDWLKILKNVQVVDFKLYTEGSVCVNKSRKNIEKLKCKDAYWHLIDYKIESSTCTKKWQEIYNEVEFDWNIIFSCAFKVARETALQSFQYKVINRFLPCKSNLFKWKKAESNICDICDGTHIDNIEHFLIQCDVAKDFWEKFFMWWKTLYHVNIDLYDLEILFGIANSENDIVLNSLNFCMLYARYYIYKCKISDNKICFNVFKIELQNRLLYEKHILQMENKIEVFVSKWQTILLSLN